MYAYTHTNVLTHARAHTHECADTCTCTHTRTCRHTHAHTHTHAPPLGQVDGREALGHPGTDLGTVLHGDQQVLERVAVVDVAVLELGFRQLHGRLGGAVLEASEGRVEELHAVLVVLPVTQVLLEELVDELMFTGRVLGGSPFLKERHTVSGGAGTMSAPPLTAHRAPAA